MNQRIHSILEVRLGLGIDLIPVENQSGHDEERSFRDISLRSDDRAVAIVHISDQSDLGGSDLEVS